MAGEEGAELEIVRRGYQAWNAGDLEGFIELMHPQVVWRLISLECRSGN